MNIELYKLTINMLQSKFENDKKLMSNSLTLVTLQFLEKSWVRRLTMSLLFSELFRFIPYRRFLYTLHMYFIIIYNNSISDFLTSNKTLRYLATTKCINHLVPWSLSSYTIWATYLLSINDLQHLQKHLSILSKLLAYLSSGIVP